MGWLRQPGAAGSTLQSAIGDTATVAEQLNDLIDNLVKVHASPSPGFSLQGI